MAALCRAVLLGLLSYAAGSAVADGTSATPLEKVTDMLKDLKKEIEDEAKAEAKSYDKFGCFCKDTTEDKSESIKSAQDDIDEYSATIEDTTSRRDKKVSLYMKRKKKHEELTQKLADTKHEFATDQHKFEVKEAQLSFELKEVDGAIKEIKAAMPSLIQSKVSDSIKAALNLADVYGVIDSKAPQAFLQSAKVDPDHAGYGFHSDKIVATFVDLKDMIQKDKDELVSDWEKDKKGFEDMIQTLEDNIDENEDAIETLDGEIEELKKEIAEARASLMKAEDQLKEDQLYLKDLTEKCELRAREWDQRSAARTDEVKAIEKALEILTSDDVKEAGRASAALLVRKAPPRNATTQNTTTRNATTSNRTAAPAKKPVSFLQAESARTVIKRLRSGLRVGSAEKRERVATILADEGRRLKSPTLSTLAMKMMDDPFVKIKDLIQQLIERLVNEAKEEAAKKGFCDAELGKSKMERDNRFSDVMRLNAKLKGLEAKKAELEDELDTLATDLKELKANLEKAKKMREEEADENKETIKQAKDGIKATAKALEVLEEYYKKAAKNFIQVSASPVDEDTDGAGFSGSYKGSKKSGGILGMLEVLHSDFERSLKVTTNDEATAQAEFVEFDRQSKMDIASKETKTILDEQALENTKNNINTGMEDMQTAQDLCDQALKELEELKPVCMDTGMSYAERVEKREEEMKALKKALCMLDENGVEAECA